MIEDIAAREKWNKDHPNGEPAPDGIMRRYATILEHAMKTDGPASPLHKFLVGWSKLFEEVGYDMESVRNGNPDKPGALGKIADALMDLKEAGNLNKLAEQITELLAKFSSKD